MIHFVGAGPGAVDLITVRGQQLIREADVIIYAGSLVNPDLLLEAKPDCSIYNSASMTLEEVIGVMVLARHQESKTNRPPAHRRPFPVRRYPGANGLPQPDITFPTNLVQSQTLFVGAPALQAEYTLPECYGRTVIITRMAGRTSVPPQEEIALLAQHSIHHGNFSQHWNASSAHRAFVAGGSGYSSCLVYKATWKDEKVLRCTVRILAQTAKQHHIHQNRFNFSWPFFRR